VVAFDDGLLNTLATAQPILAARNLPAVCFVLPGLSVAQRQIWADECFAYIMNSSAEVLDLELYHLGTITLSKDRQDRTASAEAVIEQMKAWPQTKRDEFVANVTRAGTGAGQSNSTYGLMTLEQIRMMADAGVFDIGVHSNSHPIMAGLTKEEQYREIADAMDLLRKNQISFVPVFAYPNGRLCDFNESTIEVLKQLGFVAGLTTVDGLADPEGEPFRVKRIGIGSPISRGEFKARLSGLFYLLHALLAGTSK
jgi:peptidoglycan/xylan/chitin deacetylase (PgdA/CDA1 family)